LPQFRESPDTIKFHGVAGGFFGVAQIPLLNAVSRIPHNNRRQHAVFLTGFMAPQGTRKVNHGGSVDIFDAVVLLMHESMIDL